MQEATKARIGYYGRYAKCRNLSVDEIIEKNPASTLEQPKVPLRLPKVISLKEVGMVMEK